MLELEICQDCVLGIEYGHVEGADDWPGLLSRWNHRRLFNGRPPPEPFQVGTIIHGTLVPKDVSEAVMAELDRIDKEWRACMYPPLPDDEFDDVELMVELIEALEKQAPEGFYYGSHPGDGSDFGLWPVEEDHDEFARFECDGCGRTISGQRHWAATDPNDGFDVEASDPCKSTHHDDGRDCDVDVRVGERSFSGGVTLLKDHDGRWSSWGHLEHWLDNNLANQLYQFDNRREIYDAIESAASKCVAELGDEEG